MVRRVLICLCFVQTSFFVFGQTFSDCSRHGNIEYCHGSDGKETPVATHAPSPAITSASSSSSSSAQTTAVTSCHTHDSHTYCIAGNGQEVQITASPQKTGPPPPQFTGCHSHGDDNFCLDSEGDEVQIITPDTHSENHEDHEGHEDHGNDKPAGQNCHFHAGVEHCTSEGDSEESTASCERTDREYNVPYRVGSLFVLLITSAIAVFGPIILTRFFTSKLNLLVFTIIKQLGTGIMVATAFIHLLTHAQLMFSNKCLGILSYEATTSAIVMAAIFLTFLIEYLGNRVLLSRTSSKKSELDIEHSHSTPETSSSSTHTHGVPDSALANLGHHSHHCLDKDDHRLSVMLMEGGIVFHSIILGVTLIVSGDSAYTPLFIVIIFHQMFEGLALGSRIAELFNTKTSIKLLMASIFSVTTPIGMAIGLGVLHTFNGNDKSTIIAIGTLDAFSAGILIWAAIIDMWCHDWIHGDLKDAGFVRTTVGLASLMGGMILMGLLGKWA
ncbi:hypothetical protein FQN57_005683 [Myotisia sp. PD_48]|nr:hypothetical protein FQN57_005683 [Myotisia sp. PD_48]